jgi:hypothetical protein
MGHKNSITGPSTSYGTPVDLTGLVDDLAKLDGKPPYDGPENICRNDAYYEKALEKKYGVPVQTLRRLIRKPR